MPVYWPYVYLILAVPATLLTYALSRWYALNSLRNQPTVTLELEPPAHNRKSSLATKQLFMLLHSIGMRNQSFTNMLLSRQNSFSLEVVSSRARGIRYHIRLPEQKLPAFERHLSAYYPDMKFRLVEDPLAEAIVDKKQARVVVWKQGRHYAYPLAIPEALSRHDPMAYITGSMTKLAPNEVVAFQIVLTPVRLPEAMGIRDRLARGESPELWPNIWAMLLIMEARLMLFVAKALAELMAAGLGFANQHATTATAELRPGTATSQALTNSMLHKLSEPLFRADMRLLVVSENIESQKQAIEGFTAALTNFSVQGSQRLITQHDLPGSFSRTYQLFMFRGRLPAWFHGNACVLAASEVAALYHFPHSTTSRPENLLRSLSKTLPLPAMLKNYADTHAYDIVLGQNSHQGSTTDIGLLRQDRERHVYIVGGTGNGKTTLLQYGLVQDIQSGKGVAVIDPHGDLATTLLNYIPRERLNDVVYFNPSDFDYPMGLNILELPQGLRGSELLHEQDMVTESIISIFRKTFSEDASGGHRIEYVLRNAIHTAFTVPGATLFTVLRLLNDPRYLRNIVDKLEKGPLKDFWNNEIGSAGGMQRVKMTSGVTAKVGRFQASVSAERILGRSHSTIDFEDIMNSGKILICNLSKGRLGEDTSILFGTTILAKLQMAAWRRERLPPDERRPFYLYVDEFQNFATLPFLEILSEARKYRLFLTMAEQSTSQQESAMVQNILANVGTVISFRSGNPLDEMRILPLFRPYIEKGEIANLPAYSFYMRLATHQTHEPFSGTTIVLPSPKGHAQADEVIIASRTNYARQYGPHSLKQDHVRIAPALGHTMTIRHMTPRRFNEIDEKVTFPLI